MSEETKTSDASSYENIADEKTEQTKIPLDEKQQNYIRKLEQQKVLVLCYCTLN